MERRKICRYFERGSCKKDNCPFVHLKENRKNCNFYMEGNCRKGANCNFYHPPRQQEKLATLKEQLKTKKYIKEVKKQSSSEDQVQIQIKPQQVKQQKQEVQPQKREEIQQEKKEVHQQQKEELIMQKQEHKEIKQDQKISKINFLLGINNEQSSQESSQSQTQQKSEPVKEQIQFVKIFLKKFPDFSKTAEMKAQILKNELKYFNGQKYLNLINKIEDQYQKEYYQIIRKFTDNFEPFQNQPKHFTIKMRPLLYDKQINLHFQFIQDTLNLQIDMTKYPQNRATFIILNKSIPEQYKIKFIDILNRIHGKVTVFDTLKYLQNNFQKVYGESKFRLQNQHYSKKQNDRKLKQQKKISKNVQTEKVQTKKKKITRDRSNEHPDVRIIKYKQGQKVDNLFYNYEVSVQSIILQSCQYVVVQKILAYIECVCQKKIVYLLDATNDRSLTVGVKLQCKKCQNLILLGIQRQVVQIRKDVLGRIGVNNGHLIDVGGISFKIGCACNNQISKARLYLPGQRITANCHNCFQSMLITYMGLKSVNHTLKAQQVKTDSQLPNKGACKHVKLSFRWFRFGCCGRCFSCDDCHIMESAAVHQKIKGITMLCGYCSRQQLIGYQCSFCHKQLLKGMDKSGHWEGGLGCRDQALLSRKDAKKYTGLTKQKQKQK